MHQRGRGRCRATPRLPTRQNPSLAAGCRRGGERLNWTAAQSMRAQVAHIFARASGAAPRCKLWAMKSSLQCWQRVPQPTLALQRQSAQHRQPHSGCHSRCRCQSRGVHGAPATTYSSQRHSWWPRYRAVASSMASSLSCWHAPRQSPVMPLRRFLNQRCSSHMVTAMAASRLSTKL